MNTINTWKESKYQSSFSGGEHLVIVTHQDHLGGIVYSAPQRRKGIPQTATNCIETGTPSSNFPLQNKGNII